MATPAGDKPVKAKRVRSRAVLLKDVSYSDFIRIYAAHLKKAGKIELPPYLDLIKTGLSRELAPQDPDFYYHRCASLVRHLYIHPHEGVKGMAKHYGRKYRRGVRPDHRRNGAKGIIRHCLQQLEKIGVVEQSHVQGRQLSKEGQRDCDRIAQQILFPELAAKKDAPAAE